MFTSYSPPLSVSCLVPGRWCTVGLFSCKQRPAGTGNRADWERREWSKTANCGRDNELKDTKRWWWSDQMVIIFVLVTFKDHFHITDGFWSSVNIKILSAAFKSELSTNKSELSLTCFKWHYGEFVLFDFQLWYQNYYYLLTSTSSTQKVLSFDTQPWCEIISFISRQCYLKASLNRWICIWK